MLTAREFKQLSDAVKAMYSYNINGENFVMENNVLALMGNYVEDISVDEQRKSTSNTEA